MLRHVCRLVAGVAIALLAAGVLLAPGANSLRPGTPAGAQDLQAELAKLLTSEDATSAEMAVGLLRALEGESFAPPACVAGQERFDDVPAANPFCAWIEELARRGITGGCGSGNYCPAAPVSRAQMAVFLVKVQFPPQIPAGVTITGSWGFWIDTNGTRDASVSISYPAPMPEGSLGFQYIESAEAPTVECPGSDDLPTAAPGWLCLYEDLANLSNFSSARISRFGSTVRFAPTGSGDMRAHGTWAATAPVD